MNRTLLSDDIPDCGDLALPKENYIDSIGMYFNEPKRVTKISYEYRREYTYYGNGNPVPFAWFLIDGQERGFYLYGLKKVIS